MSFNSRATLFKLKSDRPLLQIGCHRPLLEHFNKLGSFLWSALGNEMGISFKNKLPMSPHFY